jgi:hypothetical protein
MALEEANLVLSSSEYDKHRQALENFNLLSVVTNPQGNRTMPIMETRIKPMGHSHPSDETFLSSFSSSLTKEIENINATIQSYSRTYLGNNFLVSDESDYLYDMDHYLNWEYDDTNIPITLSNALDLVDFSQVESYLRTCGPMAAKFDSVHVQHANSDLTPIQSIPPDDSIYDNIQPSLLFSVPDIFFQEDFSLSDPRTFETLLLRNHQPKVSRYTGEENRFPQVALQELEPYTQYLDTIEMTLLRTVRYHAEAFFQESDRFSSLKSLVDESISEVRNLRSQLNSSHGRTVVDIESIPLMDTIRYRMRTLDRVLEEIASVLDVKSCVGGLVAAGDYLGAVEAVNVAKSWLNGERTLHYRTIQDGKKDDNYDEARPSADPLVLRKINALGRIFQEFTQYEDVVVRLVSLFQCL